MDFRVHICASSDASTRRTGGDPADRVWLGTPRTAWEALPVGATHGQHARTASEHTEVALRTPGHQTRSRSSKCPWVGAGGGYGPVGDCPRHPRKSQAGWCRTRSPLQVCTQGREAVRAHGGEPQDAGGLAMTAGTHLPQSAWPRTGHCASTPQSPHLKAFPGPVGEAGHPIIVSPQLLAPPA